MAFRRVIFIRILILCTFCMKLHDFLNVTMMIYGSWPAFLVQSLPFIGPGFDLGVRQVQEIFADRFNFSHTYVSSKNVKDCVDSGAYFTDVVDYYYYRHARDRTETADAQGILILLYAGCDDSPMFAELGREWNIVVVSCGTTFSNLRDRERFPTTIAGGPVQYDLYASAILDLCIQYNWTTIGYVYGLTQANPFTVTIYQRVIAFFRRHAPHIRINPFPVETPKRHTEYNYDLLFHRISENSRVIFLSTPSWMTREIMIRAYLRNQTTGEYVWFAVDLNEHSTGTTRWQIFEADDEIAKAAFDGMFQVMNCWDYGPEIDNLRAYWKERTRIDYNSTYPGTNGPNQFTITAYGVVHVLAQAVNESLQFENDTDNARSLIKRIQGKQFFVPTMGSFRVDQSGERQNKVCVNSFDTATGQFERKLFCDATNTKLKSVSNTSMTWRTATSAPPLSEPWCGFTGDALHCRTSGDLPVITGGVLGAAAAGLLVLLAVAFHLKRKDQKGHDLWWKMSSEQVIVLVRLEINCLTEATNVYYSKTPSNPADNQGTQRTTHGIGMLAGQERTVWVHSYGRLSADRIPFPDKNASHILRKLRTFSHPNISHLIGIVPTEQYVLIISEYAEKGSLEDALRTSALQDWELRSSLSFDLVEGLLAIHHSALKRHGNLSLTNCLVSNRFMLKISGLGYKDILLNFIDHSEKLELSSSTAPELRNKTNAQWIILASSSSDIYTFASIVDILLVTEHILSGFQEDHRDDLYQGVPIKKAAIFNDFQETLNKCRSKSPAERPTIDVIRSLYRTSFGIDNRSFTEKILARLQRHALQLENAVSDRTHELQKETHENEALLTELLPRQIVFRLKKETMIEPEHFQCISLLFSYTIGFNEFIINNSNSPLAIMHFLDQMFLSFDGVVSLYDVYKVETISDSCMVASGLPERNGDQHAKEICSCALGFRETFRNMGKSYNMSLKIGINTGSCVTGIIGRTRPRYCLFGDTINTASRVASYNTEWSIQITTPTKQLIEDTSIRAEYRGKVMLKGKGEWDVYCLL